MEKAERRLERLLANHCAPVLCRQKTANLVAASRELVCFLPEALRDSGLSWTKLCSCRKYCHLLIYDSARMETYLGKREHRAFLEDCGYREKNLDEMILFLAERYESFQKQGGEFPHEIGLFLEYPMEDIRGFIKHQGKEALACGYWKVYADVEKARERFCLYDRLRRNLRELMSEGRELGESVREMSWQLTGPAA